MSASHWWALLSHNQQLRATRALPRAPPRVNVSRDGGSVGEPVLSPGRMEAIAGVRVCSTVLLIVSATMHGLCSHTTNNAERESSAAGIAVVVFKCRRGAAGGVSMSAGMSVALPVGRHCPCQDCCLVLHLCRPRGDAKQPLSATGLVENGEEEG